jgi:hypothetical protein
MSNISFADDPDSRKVTRFLLLLQIAAMVIVVGLSLVNLFFLAFAISLLTFVVFVLIVFWLYSRYQDVPVVHEKRELERLVHKFQKGIQSEEAIIQAAIKDRAGLFQSEKDEINAALKTLQKNYIENGLAAASIQEATISGIGQKLKERLAEYSILSAAEITEKISELPGFGDTKHQALISWRSSVIEELEISKPSSLPQKKLEAIQPRYQVWHDQNNAAERKARASKQMLEYELVSFEPRLKQLAPFTFVRYLSISLAPRGIVAAPLAMVLIMTQVVSSVSATASTASSILASIPTATTVPSQTFTPTSTNTSIVTRTAPAAAMPSETNTPTLTFTLPVTSTHLPTLTPRPTLQPTNTAYIPVSGGTGNSNCDSSYPSVCIPPPPPDLDCGDISYRHFQVLSPDLHNFDRDGDGIGCES